jgi:branched-subunit amino acid ABC-type transport system permease component
MFGAHFNEQYQVLAGNILFLVVLAIRPRGLFGKKVVMS